VLGNALIAGLKGDVTRGEAALQQLSTRLGDNHPQVQEARANLTELRSRLVAETAKVTGSVTVNNNINVQRLAQVKASLDAQRTYDAILQRVTQSSLESQSTQSNVNLLTQAVAPIEPATPRVVLNIILSVVIGLLLAVVVVLLLELRQRRVRSIGDVVAALDLPVIAVLPARGGRIGARGLQLLQRKMLAALPAPGKAGAA
jgi:polysaccharide biosynthesis transport protein